MLKISVLFLNPNPTARNWIERRLRSIQKQYDPLFPPLNRIKLSWSNTATSGAAHRPAGCVMVTVLTVLTEIWVCCKWLRVGGPEPWLMVDKIRVAHVLLKTIIQATWSWFTLTQARKPAVVTVLWSPFTCKVLQHQQGQEVIFVLFFRLPHIWVIQVLHISLYILAVASSLPVRLSNFKVTAHICLVH